jgi:hypothetical protein
MEELKEIFQEQEDICQDGQASKAYIQKLGSIYQFGIQVPRHVKEALTFDKTNGNQCGRMP